MNGSGGAPESESSITTVEVETDTSRGGGLTGVALTKDAEGSFYIKKQDNTNNAIVDDAGVSVCFDWKNSFGQELVEARPTLLRGF